MMIMVLVLLPFTVFSSMYDNWEPTEYCASDLSESLSSSSSSNDVILPPHDPSLQLLQVQILARHGARAPYARVYCWDKAKSPMDVTWNCGPSEIFSQDIATSSSHGRLYSKLYSENNILTGTCVVGGLLPIGRRQHLENGR